MPIVSNKGLTAKQSSLTDRELKHLLRRTIFGLSKEHLTHFQNRSLSNIVDELLTHTSEFEQPLFYYPNFTKYQPGEVYGDIWVNNKIFHDNDVHVYLRNSFFSNLIQKHLKSTDITEKMTIFFHHFIPTDYTNVASRMYWNYRYLRDNCLGNFKTIIKKTAIDSNMLLYLNGNNNKVGAPDENFARELMELFTLGKNYSPIYSENDIQQAAKVLTGYQVDPTYGYKNIFNQYRHDTSDKFFSSFFGNKTIKGRIGIDGEKELDELIDMIFEKEEVSIYFTTRLYRYFVYYEIDDTIKNNIILPLAKIMRDNNYEVKPVLEVLFKSEHFFDTNTFGSHIKNPLDLLFGALKEFSFQPSYKTLTERYLIYLSMYKDKLIDLGMLPYYAPNVSGWSAYYQEPLMYENWITTSSFTKRVEYLNSIFTNFGDGNKVDVIEVTKKHSNPSNINVLIDNILDWHLTIEPSEDIKKHMKSILLYGQVEDHYWTDLWNAHITNPSNTQVKEQLTNVLKEFYEFLVSLPEYQLM